MARLGDVDSDAGEGAAMPVTDKYRQFSHAIPADAGLVAAGRTAA